MKEKLSRLIKSASDKPEHLANNLWNSLPQLEHFKSFASHDEVRTNLHAVINFHNHRWIDRRIADKAPTRLTYSIYFKPPNQLKLRCSKSSNTDFKDCIRAPETPKVLKSSVVFHRLSDALLLRLRRLQGFANPIALRLFNIYLIFEKRRAKPNLAFSLRSQYASIEVWLPEIVFCHPSTSQYPVRLEAALYLH